MLGRPIMSGHSLMNTKSMLNQETAACCTNSIDSANSIFEELYATYCIPIKTEEDEGLKYEDESLGVQLEDESCVDDDTRTATIPGATASKAKRTTVYRTSFAGTRKAQQYCTHEGQRYVTRRLIALARLGHLKRFGMVYACISIAHGTCTSSILR